jgi:hypothetical protein
MDEAAPMSAAEKRRWRAIIGIEVLWNPTLSAISEDAALAAAKPEAKDKPAATKAKPPR